MSEAEPSPFEWDENHAWTFEADVQACEFQRAIDPVAAIVDDAQLDITRESVHIRAVDPAKVVAVDVTVDCVEGAPDPLSAGVFISDLADNWPPYWNRSDTYRLAIDHGAGEDKVLVKHPTEGKHETKAYDPDTIRDAPDPMPRATRDFEHDVTLPAPKVRGMLGAMAETDVELIRLTPLTGKLRAEAVKSGGHVHHRWIVSAPGLREGDYEYYSADYLADIARSLWPDGDVRVQFGVGQPLSLTNGALQFVQAPRIEPDFEEEA
jgi:hypothetical protein